MKIKLHDNYKILPEIEVDTCIFPELDAFVKRKTQIPKWLIGHPTTEMWRKCQEYKVENAVKSLLHSTRGTITMKMLLVHADGREHHFTEMARACGIKEGYDIDCWKSLVNRGLIAYSSTHKRGSKYYTITSFGRFIVDVVIKSNDIFYKPIRWFKNVDDDKVYENLLKAGVGISNCPLDDASPCETSPETMLDMVKSLLDSSSMLYKLGTVCKWMNTFMYVLKSSKEFYSHVNVPEVNEWLDANINLSEASKNFYKKWKRMQKMWLKKSNA